MARQLSHKNTFKTSTEIFLLKNVGTLVDSNIKLTANYQI